MSKRKNDTLDDEYELDDTVQVSPRKQCPAYCSMFKCAISENLSGKCRQECSKLDATKSLICEICSNNQVCSDERKKILLDIKYLDYMNKIQGDKTSSVFDDLKIEYRAMEIQLQDIRDAFYKCEWYDFSKKEDAKQKSATLKLKLKIYADIMEKLGIEFEKKVKVDEE